MKLRNVLFSAAFAAVMLIQPAHATLSFNIQYSAAVQANLNFGAIQNAVNFVENEYSSHYSDPITLNFLIDQNSSGLGQSLFSNDYFRGNYAAVRAALVGDAKSTDDATATTVANLPLAAPYADACGGAIPNCWYAPSAEAKALGLAVGSVDTCGGAFLGGNCDGTYTFNALQTFTFDPNNRGTGGFDFIGVTEHEFSELMGRGAQVAGFGYNILDTMRFTSTGTRQLGQTPGAAYFSFDNGVTHLHTYNAGGGDRQDWDGSVANDPFNASTGPNQAHALSAEDFQLLDVIGYDLITVPEPSQLVPVAGALGLLLIGFRKRRA